MRLEDIKTILFTLTLILLLYKVLFKKYENQNTLHFLLSSILVTALVVSIIIVKLHHLLRHEFNISNTITYGLVSIPIFFHFYKFRKEIYYSDFVLLIISFVFFGLALVLDLLTDGKIIVFNLSDLVEEILRIIGAGFWLVYYFLFFRKLNNNTI